MNHLFIKTTILASAILGFSSLVGRAQTNWILTGNSATSPGTNFLGTTDSKDFVIKTNGKEAMRVDKSQNVGIGTSKPAATLDILSKTSAALQLEPFGIAAANTGELRMLELLANGIQYAGFKAPDKITSNVIWTLPNADGSNGSALTTDGAGHLSWQKGVNTSLSNLSSLTAVNKDLLPNSSFSESLGSSALRWKDLNLFNLKFSDGQVQTTASKWLNNSSFVYYNGGNVGIGTSTPTQAGLVVNAANGVSNAVFASGSAGVSLLSINSFPTVGFNANFINGVWSSLTTGYSGTFDLNPFNGSLEFYNTSSSQLAGEPVSLFTRMVIASTGFVGINNVAPAAQLDILEPGSNSALIMVKSGFNPGVEFNKNNTTSTTPTLVTTNDGGGDALDGFAENGSGIFASTTNAAQFAGFFDGNVFTTGTYQSSDEKLKQNIRDFTDASSLIDQLHPKLYQFKRDSIYAYLSEPLGDHYGLIAQDVEKVFPNMVKEAKFDTRIVRGIHSEEPSPDDLLDFKTLNYTELIPIMIKGLQEQQQTIDELQQELNDLESASQQTSSADLSVSNTEDARASNNVSQVGLDQNVPNPFSQNTTIHYHLADNTSNAQLVISDVTGLTIKSFALSGTADGQVTINGGELNPGIYFYSLVVDGRKIDTKQMTLTK